MNKGIIKTIQMRLILLSSLLLIYVTNTIATSYLLYEENLNSIPNTEIPSGSSYPIEGVPGASLPYSTEDPYNYDSPLLKDNGMDPYSPDPGYTPVGDSWVVIGIATICYAIIQRKRASIINLWVIKISKRSRVKIS